MVVLSENLLVRELQQVAALVGNSPLRRLRIAGCEVFTKLEYSNFSGSIKDRAAINILREAIKSGAIIKDSVIVESSSGNFAIALMGLCKILGLRFISVIDPNINKSYEMLLRLGCEVVKVTQPDETGGYLLNRIKQVKYICETEPNAFWTDQYSNPNNYLGYYEGLGDEICRHFDKLDFIFIGVSSGGTITGVSQRIKEKFPNVKVIAVDIEGSLIFGAAPRPRYISGIGASKVPSILKEAIIDDVVHLTHLEIIEGCHRLLHEHAIFAGASSGASYAALNKYFKKLPDNKRILFFCPDRGSGYIDTIYNTEWVEQMRPLFD